MVLQFLSRIVHLHRHRLPQLFQWFHIFLIARQIDYYFLMNARNLDFDIVNRNSKNIIYQHNLFYITVNEWSFLTIISQQTVFVNRSQQTVNWSQQRSFHNVLWNYCQPILTFLEPQERPLAAIRILVSPYNLLHSDVFKTPEKR